MSDYILSLGDDISETHLKLYAAFRKIRNVITVICYKKKLVINLPLDVQKVIFEEGFREMLPISAIGAVVRWNCS